MAYKTPPSGSILGDKEFYGVRNGRKVWVSADRKRYYTWDSQHGEVEVFDRRGHHLGVVDPQTGAKVKDAVKGRKIDVN